MNAGTWCAFSAAFRRMWADPTVHVGELYSHALVFGGSGGEPRYARPASLRAKQNCRVVLCYLLLLLLVVVVVVVVVVLVLLVCSVTSPVPPRFIVALKLAHSWFHSLTRSRYH